MSLDNIKYIIVESLSNLFNKLASSNNDKIITTIASELTEVDENIKELKRACTVATASSGDLDLHGQAFGIQRQFKEEDEPYRQKLLSSYTRATVTFNNLKALVQLYSDGSISAYQYFYDRWWLGGKHYPSAAIENTCTITGTIVRASSALMEDSVPECWLITDTTKTGTNYASGSTFVNDSSGSLITLTTPVSAGTPVTLIYTPSEVISGDYTYDFTPYSFINDDTIMKYRVVSNNFILLESSKTYIKIATNLLPGYYVKISYYDEDVGTIYNWDCVVDDDKNIIINESKRTDNLIIDEYSLPTSTTQVNTVYDIGNVQGVWLATDTNKLGTNYSTSNNYSNKIIFLDTPLLEKFGVIATYNKFHIDNYENLNFNQLIKTGKDDLRFTIQFDIWEAFHKYGTFKYGEKRWGEFIDPSAIIVGQMLDIAKAAGIKSDIVVLTNEVKYGNVRSIYGEVSYLGSFW